MLIIMIFSFLFTAPDHPQSKFRLCLMRDILYNCTGIYFIRHMYYIRNISHVHRTDLLTDRFSQAQYIRTGWPEIFLHQWIFFFF